MAVGESSLLPGRLHSEVTQLVLGALKGSVRGGAAVLSEATAASAAATLTGVHGQGPEARRCCAARHGRRASAPLGGVAGGRHSENVDDRNAELDQRITARVEYLNATRGWPWMEPGVESVGLDGAGQVTRYLATDTVVLGHHQRPADGE